MELAPFDALYPATSRYAEVEKILRFIKEGNSCQVVGLPGVGRANLLGLLAYNRNVRIQHLGEDQQKWLHFVMINFAELRHKSLHDVIKLLFLTLVDSLKERNKEEAYTVANTIFKESLSYNDELMLFQGLKKAIDLIALDQQLTIVFLFERFETYIPVLTADFFTNLRILRSRAKYRFSVVFSLNKPLEDLIDPAMMADFYEFLAGHLVYVAVYDKLGMDFRIAYLEKATGKTLPKKLVEETLLLTGGHGKLTKLCLESISNYVETKKTSVKDTPDFFLQQKTIQGALYEILYALSPTEQKFIRSSNEPYPRHEFLEKVGLLKDGKIAIRLFALFVHHILTSNATAAAPIVYHPETNTITKGGQTISEQLTVSEFRLLRFLLENKNRIVEKEEIIQAVWKEAKTTAGVTDQALDQLLFRLRKKIENDPNNPVYIQTVKGRGLKFAA